ncbi:MAG: GGDEF domain-containing protein [Eubacteriales bacterium]|nr:GGDEF domain-containing protein [Eubacteriales bacterium]
MKNLLLRFQSFVLKDVENENEARKTALLIRLFTLIMSAYFLIQSVVLLLACNWNVSVIGVFCLSSYMALFFGTYMNHTKIVLNFLQIISIFWIVHYVYMLGWDSGVQDFLFAILVFNFIASTSSLHVKVCYGAFLWMAWNGLFLLVNLHPSVYTMGLRLQMWMQIINIMFIFIIVTVSIYIFSKEAQQMESKLVKYNERVRKMADIDALTQLYNRRAVLEAVNKRIDVHKNDYALVDIAIADIDFFKRVNDTYGHEGGDVVLRNVAQMLQEMVAPYGEVGRWGGEEFLIAFYGINGDEACGVLEDIRRRIQKTEIEYQEQRISVTMTFGLEEYEYGHNIDETISKADQKLYSGKNAGRNRVVF